MDKKTQDHKLDMTLDVRGHKCPIPVLRLRKFMESLTKGDEVTVRATDPMTELDIPHFCSHAGHILIRQWKKQVKQQQKIENEIFFLIKKNKE